MFMTHFRVVSLKMDGLWSLYVLSVFCILPLKNLTIIKTYCLKGTENFCYVCSFQGCWPKNGQVMVGLFFVFYLHFWY